MKPWPLSGFCDEASVDFKTQIAVAQRAGLKQLDIRIVDGRNISDLTTTDVAPLAAALRESGLTCSCLASGIGKTDLADDFAIDLARLDRLASHADALACHSVRVFSTFNKDGAPLDVWRSESLRRLEALSTRAAQFGLTLLIENERYLYGDRLTEVLDLVQTTELGLIFDFDNFHQSGDDPWTNWNALREFVKVFHLKDSDADLVHVHFGSGAGKAKEILSDAKAKDWRGALSLEPHLVHSDAVLATVPHGRGSQEGQDPIEAFLVGASESKKFLTSLGISFQ